MTTKRRLQRRLLVLQLIQAATAVDGKKRSGRLLPPLIHKMKKTTDPSRFVGKVIWEGKLVDADDTLEDGWYSTGSPTGQSRAASSAQVKGKRASVKLLSVPDTSSSSSRTLQELLAKRKKCTVVEDAAEKLAWQECLRRVLQKNRKRPHPGLYRFVYREHVSEEELSIMVARRGGFAPIRLHNDSAFVLLDTGDCYMEDYAALIGIIPIKTHNTGRVDRGKIHWKSSSVVIGWKGLFGKTLEMRTVTDLLCKQPWSLSSYEQQPGGPPVLLMNRPDKGWLMWQRNE
jgi:hypothetical protein